MCVCIMQWAHTDVRMLRPENPNPGGSKEQSQNAPILVDGVGVTTQIQWFQCNVLTIVRELEPLKGLSIL